MTAADLDRLARIVELRAKGHTLWFGETPNSTEPPAVWFLLDLLAQVARTAGRHYSPSPDVWQQDGEIDALAILDTITGENHIHPVPNLGVFDVLKDGRDWPPKYL